MDTVHPDLFSCASTFTRREALVWIWTLISTRTPNAITPCESTTKPDLLSAFKLWKVFDHRSVAVPAAFSSAALISSYRFTTPARYSCVRSYTQTVHAQALACKSCLFQIFHKFLFHHNDHSRFLIRACTFTCYTLTPARINESCKSNHVTLTITSTRSYRVSFRPTLIPCHVV